MGFWMEGQCRSSCFLGFQVRLGFRPFRSFEVSGAAKDLSSNTKPCILKPNRAPRVRCGGTETNGSFPKLGDPNIVLYYGDKQKRYLQILETPKSAAEKCARKHAQSGRFRSLEFHLAPRTTALPLRNLKQVAIIGHYHRK